MSILQSIFLGSHGQYNIAGYDVEFTNGRAYAFAESSCSLRTIGCIADAVLGSTVLRVLTQGNLHTLVHEMGHACASHWLDPEGRFPSIRIFTNSGSGETHLLPQRVEIVDNVIIIARWKSDVIDLAGPMADMLFSGGKLILAVALRNYISLPVASILGAGALLYMIGELLYAAFSAINQDGGDFGKIARSGAIPLFIATAALVGTFALGIFGAVKLW